jgi:hypothetical protein
MPALKRGKGKLAGVIRNIKKVRFDSNLLKLTGAGNEIRTRDFNLGKVALYH